MKTTFNTKQKKSGKNNLITLLRTFSKKEMQEFAKFSKSTFFNGKQNVINYISALAKLHPEFKENVMTKQKLHSLIYPGKKFVDINIRRLNSYSLKLLEDYLYNVHGRNDPFEKDHYVILEYMKRDSITLAASNIERCLKANRMESLFLKEYYERRSKLNYYRSLLEKYKKKESRFGHYAINSCSDSFASSHVNLALNYTDLYMEKDMFKVELTNSVVCSYFNDLDISKTIERAKEVGDESYPILKLHYLMTRCIQDTLNDDTYKEFNQLLSENESKLSHDSLVQLGWFRYNYILLKRKDVGNRNVYLGIYELTKELCVKNLLKFSHERYIVQGYGLILGASDLAGSKGDLEFLIYLQKNVVKQLQPEFRQLTGQFMRLHEQYIRKNYKECVEILRSTQVDHYLFFQRFKILEVQIFFDMCEYEHVLNLVDSFKHYYKNKHITPQVYQVIMKFLNVVVSLSKLMMSFTRHDAEMIQKSITEIDANVLRNWLEPRFKSILEKYKKAR